MNTDSETFKVGFQPIECKAPGGRAKTKTRPPGVTCSRDRFQDGQDWVRSS